MPNDQQSSRPLPSVEELLEQSQEVRDTADELTAIGYATRGEEVREFCLNVEAYLTRSESAPSNDAEDAARWRWLLDNATRMSEPLEARRPNSHAITGHRVSLIVDFKGDHTTTPWATQQTFTEHVDMERLSERGG